MTSADRNRAAVAPCSMRWCARSVVAPVALRLLSHAAVDQDSGVSLFNKHLRTCCGRNAERFGWDARVLLTDAPRSRSRRTRWARVERDGRKRRASAISAVIVDAAVHRLPSLPYTPDKLIEAHRHG